MPRILLIALSSTHFGQIKANLIKNNFTVTLTSEVDEISELISSAAYDCYLLEPFSNFKMAAKIIRILNEKNCLHKILLILPGLRPHEELTAKKIVQENYFSINDSFEYIIDKINFICSTNSTIAPNRIKISSPITHYIKSEIEKAKRGNTSLSFLYLRTQNNNHEKTNSIILKINAVIHDRLRISDEAFPFQTGLLILLFGTSKVDRPKIKAIIFNKIKSSLQEENISFHSYFETTEATYPQDGKSYSEIIQFLEDPISETKTSNLTDLNLSEMLLQLEPFDKSFRRGRKENVADAIEINSYIPVNFLPPTWLGAFYQIENDPIKLYQCFVENEPQIAARIMAISNKLIRCFPQYIKNTNFNSAKTFQEIISIIGIDEFKNICIFSVLENVFSLELDQNPTLKNQVYLQLAVALELSKSLDYQKKTELLLCLLCQNFSYILIKKKSPILYQSIYDKNKTTNTSIGKLFFERLNFTPSELSRLFLKNWNIEEQIAESAFCTRYEFIPKLNPQLTAIAHLTIVTANFLAKENYEQNLKLSKIAIDEIWLRNRSFKFEAINYLNDNDNPWRENFFK